MPKIIQKKDAKNDPEMSYKGTKGGAPGGKEGKPPKAAPAAYWLILFDNAMTPASVGGFWDLRKIENLSKIVSQLPAAIYPLRA